MEYQFPSNKKVHLTWEGRQESFQMEEYPFSMICEIEGNSVYQNIRDYFPELCHEVAKLSIGSQQFNQEWRNKLIHGDSLHAMAQLLHDGMQNKIQMIYFDPPFGIEFDASFQHGDTNTEGYLDTWEQDLAGYLASLRERLLLCKNLLSESGSLFLQIGPSNLHYVKCILDEIFGSENYMNLITFRTAISTNNVTSVADYLLWYAKDHEHCFQRELYQSRSLEKTEKTFTYQDTKDPTLKFKAQEVIKKISAIKSKNTKKKREPPRNFALTVNKTKYVPPQGYEWRWDKNAMERLIQLDRLAEIGGKLYGKRFESDFPVMILTNIWTDTTTSTFAAKKIYSVHTNPKVIQRCMAIATRPGDLVFDPSGGSGTTAYVAERFGRRWILCDSSPTSILASISWLIGEQYDIFEREQTSPNSVLDFKYIEYPKISLAKLALNLPTTPILLYDQPKIQTKNGRACNPFCLYEQPKKLQTTEKIHEILAKNGILTLELADEGKIQKIVTKSFQQESNITSEIISQHSDLLHTYGVRISTSSWSLDFINNHSSANFDDYLSQIHNSPEKWIILSNCPVYSPLENRSLFQKFVLSKDHNSKLRYGIMHQDLWNSYLNYEIHQEAFREFTWDVSKVWQSIALVMVLMADQENNGVLKTDVIFLPKYQKYLKKQYQLLGKVLEYNTFLSITKKRLKKEHRAFGIIVGIDYLGTWHCQILHLE